MGTRSLSPLRLLVDALRGVGAPLGGARRIQFLPALAGGHASAALEEYDPELLDRLGRAKERALLADRKVLSWKPPVPDAQSGALTLRELDGVVYEGQGVWQLSDQRRFRLLADYHVVPAVDRKTPSALLDALQGDGSQFAGAHSLVILDERGQYEAVCGITLLVEPALQAALTTPDDPDIKTYLAGPHAGATILACVNPLTEEAIRFDLPTLLAAKYRTEGVFEVPGLRFAVLAFRHVMPEVRQPVLHGFVLPRLDFRPPAAPLH